MKSMENIIVAWRSSLALLLPQTLVPILQVTLKTLLEVYVLLITQLWWFLGLGLGIYCMTLQPAFYITWLVLWSLFLVVLARPSVEQKDFWYLAPRIPYGFFVMALFFISWYLWYVNIWLVFLLLPYYAFFMFFLCDSNYVVEDMVRAPWRAAKLSLTFAPISLLISIFLGLSTHFLLGNIVARSISLFFIAPFFIVLLSRLYIMGIHKEYKEYYERCW